jgi:hypothetical protein
MVRHSFTFTEFRENNKEWVKVEVDACTRRVTFSYLNSDIWYEFGLKSECVDWAQELMTFLLKKNKIQTLPVEDESNYYTIVTNSNLPFEK